MRSKLLSSNANFTIRGITAAVAMLSLPVIAGETDSDQESSWGLGIGVMSSQKAYTDIDSDTNVIPFIAFENKYIEVLGPNLKYKLPSFELNDSNKFNFGIVGKYDFSDIDPSETPILNGMEERKGSFWGGVQAEWESDYAEVSIEWLSDVSGDSKGNMFNLGIEKTWHFGENYTLTPRVLFSWVDKKYVDYYYGVRANEVTSNRFFYQGDSTLNTEISLRGGYMFNEKHMVFLDVAVTSLGTEIKDSPLVDSSTESQVTLAYVYRF